MKKFVTLCALVSSIGFSQDSTTTSTKEINVSDQSFMQRIGGYYFGSISKNVLSTDNSDVPGSSWLNYLNASYKLTNDTSISTTFRFQLVDTNDENGKGDRFTELDQRVAVSTTFFSQGMFTGSGGLTIELPTSRNSQEDDRIMKLKPSFTLTTKIDDYNTLATYLQYNKTIYNSANDSVDATSRHYYVPAITYTNKYFSENIVLKVEYSALVDHVPGTADTNIKKSDGTEELALGVTFNAFDFSINPYLTHDPAGMKATNTLGGAIDIFRAF